MLLRQQIRTGVYHYEQACFGGLTQNSVSGQVNHLADRQGLISVMAFAEQVRSG